MNEWIYFYIKYKEEPEECFFIKPYVVVVVLKSTGILYKDSGQLNKGDSKVHFLGVFFAKWIHISKYAVHIGLINA